MALSSFGPSTETGESAPILRLESRRSFLRASHIVRASAQTSVRFQRSVDKTDTTKFRAEQQPPGITLLLGRYPEPRVGVHDDQGRLDDKPSALPCSASSSGTVVSTGLLPVI